MINVPEGVASQIPTTKTYTISIEEHGRNIDALMSGAVSRRYEGKFKQAYGNLQCAQARLNLVQRMLNAEFVNLKSVSPAHVFEGARAE